MINKVLGIHGKESDINKKSWQEKKKLFKEHGMQLDLFQFNRSIDPTYSDWEVTFKEINFLNYDTIYTSSLWWMMTLKYLYENDIFTNRLVMVVPWISFRTINGLQPNLAQLYRFWPEDLTKVAWEIIILSVKDDEVVPYQSGEELAELTNAEFVLLEDGGHSLHARLEEIVKSVKFWIKRD